MKEIHTSAEELTRLITAVVREHMIPAVYEEILGRVEAQLFPEVVETARREGALHARHEARAEVRDMIGKEFIITVTAKGAE